METPLSAPHTKHPRLFRWIRISLITLVGLATVTALVYTEENWRGKRIWEHRKQAMAAKGEIIDWAAFVPSPVPDDQNIFKAANMSDWFVGRGARALSTDLTAQMSALAGNNVVGAELKIVAPGTDGSTNSAALDLDDPATPKKVMNLVRASMGPVLVGAVGPNGVFLKSIPQHEPVHVTLTSKTALNENAMSQRFARLAVRNIPRIQSTGTNTFRLVFERARTATEYLAATTSNTDDINCVREALKRPYARIEGDYQHVYTAPIPNFAVIRSFVQFMAERAKCHLLLGQPNEALQEITLIHEARRLVHAEPHGKPVTLVEAMIDVSVTGLYAGVVADGLRLNAWRDSDLVEIQKQIGTVNLLPSLVWAMNAERTGASQMLETCSWRELREIVGKESTLSKTMLLISIVPHGWICLNLDTGARMTDKILETVDLTNGTVSPHSVNKATQEIVDSVDHPWPSTFIVRIGTPDFKKAFVACARNQILANEGVIACALERYRNAHGQYPETLDSLVPQYVTKLPMDILKGKPLHYRLTGDGHYRLYSVGWNETDEGGVPGSDDEKDDWVWPL